MDVKLTIWEPRYHDNTVLIAKWKISSANRYFIKFSKAPQYKDREFIVKGSDITSCPVEHKNHGDFYVVPLATVLGDSAQQLNLIGDQHGTNN